MEKKLVERPYLQSGMTRVDFIKLPEGRKQAIEGAEDGDEVALRALEELYFGGGSDNFHPDELNAMRSLVQQYRKEFDARHERVSGDIVVENIIQAEG